MEGHCDCLQDHRLVLPLTQFGSIINYKLQLFTNENNDLRHREVDFAHHVFQDGDYQVHDCDAFTHVVSASVDLEHPLDKQEQQLQIGLFLAFHLHKHVGWVSGDVVLECN